MISEYGTEIDALVEEYKLYLETANSDITTGDIIMPTEEEQKNIHLRCPRILEWWEKHHQALPHWSLFARHCAVLQPSSAAAERVFSIVNALFTDSQEQCLSDYFEGGTMMRYNSNCPCKKHRCHEGLT